MNLEIITTQNETLKETGFGAFQTCNAILQSINSMGYTATLNICQTVEELNEVVKRKPDLVILAVKYIITEDGIMICLSEFFAKNKINFSGSLKDTVLFDSDKVLAKSYLKDKGIRTPRFFTAVPGEYKRDYDIPINYPLFLRPMHSKNCTENNKLSHVNNYTEFENRVSALYSLYNQPVLVEEHLDGQNFMVSLIKAPDGDMLVAAIKILIPTPEKNISFVNEVVKHDTSKEFKTIEDSVTLNNVKNLAIDAYIDLNVRDFGQIDIKTNKNGHCFFIQANLLPNMTEQTSSFTKAFEMDLGLSYNEVIEHIVSEGLTRA